MVVLIIGANRCFFQLDMVFGSINITVARYFTSYSRGGSWPGLRFGYVRF